MSDRTQIKDWVNIVGGSLLAIMLLIGSYKLLSSDFDVQKGISNFFPFIPSLVITIALVVTRIIVEGDVSTNMCFLLIIFGFVFFTIGLYSKDENTKSAMFGGGGSLLGVGLGVPFGELLRNVEARNRRRNNN